MDVQINSEKTSMVISGDGVVVDVHHNPTGETVVFVDTISGMDSKVIYTGNVKGNDIFWEDIKTMEQVGYWKIPVQTESVIVPLHGDKGKTVLNTLKEFASNRPMF